jgi:hypothetical protein
MYSKKAVKSYAQGKERVSSYKRNLVPFGAVGASAAMTMMEEGFKEGWRKGKKSKLGRILSNPKLPWLRGLSIPNLEEVMKKKDQTYDLMRREGFDDKRATEVAYTAAEKLAKELKKHNKKNPGVSPEVEDLSKDWHGREVRGSTEVEEIEQYEEDLVDLGYLEELGVIGGDGNQFTITFKKDRPTLACDGNGQSLEIIGGDQELNLSAGEIEHKGKLLVPIGYVYSIVYETDKHHLEGSNGYPESYEHYFAEDYYKKSLNPDKFKNMDDWFDELMDMGLVDKAKESGRLPVVVYNKTDCKIMLAGGGYEVTDLGIKD